MVATRKKPAQPVTSRSNTTQAVPRVPKAKELIGDDALVTQNGVSAGKDTRSSPSPKSKTKRKTPTPMPPRKSLLECLFFPCLILFFIYTLLVCPSDTAHTHTVCRSLQQYRHRILEPYVIPPIRAAITHPIIQEPYKTHVEPVLERVIIASEPAIKAVKFADHKARPVLVAGYNKGKAVYVGTLVPWWNRAVVPRYNLHVAPHVEKHLGPVFSATEQYVARLHPYVRTVQVRVHRFQAALEPYVLKAYRTLLDVYHKAQPHVQKAYETVRPHAIRLWEQAKPFLCRAWGVIKVQSRIALRTLGIQMRRLAVELGNARRQYVDPHILRIWEKVSESGSSSFDSGKEEGDIINLDDIPETDESTVAPTPTPAVSPSPSPISSSSEVFESVEVTPTPAETANDEVVTPAATPVDTEQEEKEKAVSVAEESAGHASSVVAEIEREVSEVTPTPAPEPEPEVTSSSIVDSIVEPEPTPEVNEEEASAASIVAASAGGESVLVHGEVVPTAAVTEEDAEEIDDFLRDLGLDNASESESSDASDAEVVQQQQPPEKELTPEEKKAETAAKRKDIVGRHVRWQAELDSLAKEKERIVKKAIEEVRTAAVQELKEMSNGLRDNSGKLRSSKDSSKARGVVDGVQFEGEKLLKGVDAYLSKAEKRSEEWKRVPGEQKDKEVKEKKRADEEGKWTKVLEKVEEKFGEIVKNVQGEVNVWYRQVREREIAQVLDASQEVKLLAERAQADIGLDYAWLDDVTYNDWQKYHDLMRTSEAFEQTTRSLQNSTHPAHPADPVLGALNSLEREMQDVVAGFNVRIAELGSLGRSVFSPFVDGEEEDTTYSVKDVPKDEVEDLDGGVLLGGKEVVGSLDVTAQEEEEQVVLGLGAAPVAPQNAEEPKVSILPVADEKVSENEEVVDASKIILGKSKEQVEGALAGVSREEL